MKGLFIPEITAEMFRNGCLESIEALMAEGKVYDIEYSSWVSVHKRLPKINQRVLLKSNGGTVFIGHRAKPDLVWQVTTSDGRTLWVYDPEAYTDDIDGLPKAEDCSFDPDCTCGEALLSVTSINYNPKFEGVIEWKEIPNT